MAFDPSARVSRYSAIFVALGGPWTIRPSTAQAITERRPLIVDLSVPSAVDPTIADTLGDRMVTADDLAVITAAEAPVGEPPDSRTDDLVEHTVQLFLDWQARSDSRAAADALVRRADREREAELDVLWRKLPTLEPEARAAIEGMTRHLAARLLRQPLERLGRDSDGSEGRTVRDLFAL